MQILSVNGTRAVAKLTEGERVPKYYLGGYRDGVSWSPGGHMTITPLERRHEFIGRYVHTWKYILIDYSAYLSENLEINEFGPITP